MAEQAPDPARLSGYDDPAECVAEGRHGPPGYQAQRAGETNRVFEYRVGKQQRRCLHCGRFVFVGLWPAGGDHG